MGRLACQTQLAWMAFVGSDEEEGEPDARTQNAQPIEVDIPPTYVWGVVSAQLQAWQYKSAEKTADGTLEALRAVCGSLGTLVKWPA